VGASPIAAVEASAAAEGRTFGGLLGGFVATLLLLLLLLLALQIFKMFCVMCCGAALSDSDLDWSSAGKCLKLVSGVVLLLGKDRGCCGTGQS
jgi:hypothetical protein